MDENLVTFHQKNKIICLSFLRISTSGYNDAYYTITDDESSYELTFEHHLITFPLRYNSSCSIPNFEDIFWSWELYKVNEDGNSFFLLTHNKKSNK